MGLVQILNVFQDVRDRLAVVALEVLVGVMMCSGPFRGAQGHNFWFGRLIVSTAMEEGASDTTRLDKELIISLSSPPIRRGARTAVVESHGPFFRQAGSFYRLPQSRLGIL